MWLALFRVPPRRRLADGGKLRPVPRFLEAWRCPLFLATWQLAFPWPNFARRTSRCAAVQVLFCSQPSSAVLVQRNLPVEFEHHCPVLRWIASLKALCAIRRRRFRHLRHCEHCWRGRWAPGTRQTNCSSKGKARAVRAPPSAVVRAGSDGGVPAWNATLAWELSTAYYGQVQETDLMVGRILKALGKLRDARQPARSQTRQHFVKCTKRCLTFG